MSGDRHPELPLDPDPAETPVGPRPLHRRTGAIVLVAAGGSLGSAARYGLTIALPTHSGAWPTATFLVNVAGAFILGALLEGLARRGSDSGWRQRARLLFGTGFCGALTTYSTFAVETDELLRDHHGGMATAYALISVVAGILATAAGVVAAAAQHLRTAPDTGHAA